MVFRNDPGLPEPAPEREFDLRRCDVDLLAQVAQRGSLREAARRLAMPQSTARQRVAHLERSVGAQVLCTDWSGTRLTDVGWALLRSGRVLMDTLAQGVSEAIGVGRGPGRWVLPSLRMAAPDEQWEDLAADLVRWLPRVVLDLRLRPPSTCRRMFERYEVDAVYGWDVPARPFGPHREATVHTVLTEPLWALLAADH